MPDWDERYRRGERANDAPHPLIVEFASTLEPGRALDVACGAGRHAIWLAEHGWQVTAVDRSRVAIEILRRRASEKGLAIDSRIADLERGEFIIEPESYDLIVVCNYLQRDLFPAIRAGARIGGAVIAIIAMADDDPNVKPMNPAFLLKPGELRAEFAAWELLREFEGKPLRSEHRRAMAEIIARRLR
ncbi:MAG: putative S-adenosyl-L-methionine-dependent methyltransferase TehB [Acidobacteria bacterium]|nr:putative S-adenosyl-L-methionine-dependent methyltransferase TehB [Acidobacteriota bacterium]